MLISPIATRHPDWADKELPVSITKEQVKNNPDIDTDKPVSRRHELGYLADVDWMPVVQHAKVAQRYTAYTRFNGASGNYDGFGENAKDNNSVFLLAWFLL